MTENRAQSEPTLISRIPKSEGNPRADVFDATRKAGLSPPYGRALAVDNMRSRSPESRRSMMAS